MNMTRVIIIGSQGRMGKALVACAANFRELEIVGQIDAGDDLSAVIAKSDVDRAVRLLVLEKVSGVDAGAVRAETSGDDASHGGEHDDTELRSAVSASARVPHHQAR